MARFWQTFTCLLNKYKIIFGNIKNVAKKAFLMVSRSATNFDKLLAMGP